MMRNKGNINVVTDVAIIQTKIINLRFSFWITL